MTTICPVPYIILPGEQRCTCVIFSLLSLILRIWDSALYTIIVILTQSNQAHGHSCQLETYAVISRHTDAVSAFGNLGDLDLLTSGTVHADPVIENVYQV